ncbi:dTDP-4-dehydrorhamnose 3,5-epimerase (plasmid) [Methylocystis sp. MJC1]|jgi:dTDP-4-dehydrorhamnose 3,5-epimerase|uniref:dTDP-4-dehydrorhamnose 3,5-epimerase n=1 Tax=Methylocystis sp. MJC1 TaxID=2654282 RepID=UPI0013ECA713|nr:dTDP-4-dehydrorhamnose 3,5-epimerase [Methylocystis sp. MJC1]KAF2988876.1 dTDP-4-dehydrorhamnose 3,5-epimerase [Methylocystis sp. MJC1]MBU6529106.1 dTDP-4-dehydrorhamnose 3,5-epimerase [Methylocystis sp. MJC1]UZX14044.1 dTDP-4-dehydrorhamnose 3,5-epimerase [Methylocystis sp. MJC1]
MEFIDSALPGCRLIRMTPAGDARGYFVRTFCAREFSEQGLNPELAQASYSFNARRGTVRGLHFQAAPQMEDKLVRCVRGAIFDVMVDIRPGSSTFGRWVGYELTEYNHMQLHSVRGFAHGFQTLTDDCVVAYHIAQFYDPQKAAGVRWDDPDIGIDWPLPPTDQSPRDLQLPRLADVDRGALSPFAPAAS